MGGSPAAPRSATLLAIDARHEFVIRFVIDGARPSHFRRSSMRHALKLGAILLGSCLSLMPESFGFG